MGGQACVLYGAAEFSRDLDLALLPDPANLDRLEAALAELDAEVIAVPGREPFGAAAILRQHPHTCPNKSKKSPAPHFHAATKAAREALRKAYGLFLAAFREAVERLKSGDRTATFPNGCFPPSRSRTDERHRRKVVIGVQGPTLIEGFQGWTTSGKERLVRMSSQRAKPAAEGPSSRPIRGMTSAKKAHGSPYSTGHGHSPSTCSGDTYSGAPRRKEELQILLQYAPDPLFW